MHPRRGIHLLLLFQFGQAPIDPNKHRQHLSKFISNLYFYNISLMTKLTTFPNHASCGDKPCSITFSSSPSWIFFIWVRSSSCLPRLPGYKPFFLNCSVWVFVKVVLYCFRTSSAFCFAFQPHRAAATQLYGLQISSYYLVPRLHYNSS